MLYAKMIDKKPANRKEMKKALLEALDKAEHECRTRIYEMTGDAKNPQAALMIEKNKGYLMAINDMQEILYSSNMRF